jgi:carbon-monoxide dehydrogenase medium subunit
MIPASFDYVRAGSLREALNAIASSDGSTKVLAGGHSLIPMMRFRLAQPGKLVDIGGLTDLRGIAENRKGAKIGALTTYREVLESDILRERFPLLAEATENIGDVQVRNRGTVGGSLAHADPASDWPALMLALDATFNLRSKSGKRAVKAREYFKGPFQTELRPDELLVEIVLPPLPNGAGTAYVCHEQAASGYAIAAAAAIVARTRKTINHAVVALTGLSNGAALVTSAQQLVGTKGEPEAIQRVAETASDGQDVIGDIHAPENYRRHLLGVTTREALTAALERAR